MAGLALILGEEAPDSPKKARSVESGKADEACGDRLEGRFDLAPADESVLHHRRGVPEIPIVTSGEFREELRAEVVVKHADLPPVSDVWRVLLPIFEFGQKLVRARKLDVDLELLFEAGKQREASRRLGIEFEVDVHCRVAPPVPEGRGTPYQVEAPGTLDSASKLGKEALDPLAICGTPHAWILGRGG